MRCETVCVLEQDEITGTEHYFAEEDHIIAFLKSTQKETLDALEQGYGTDANDEIFKALRAELRVSPCGGLPEPVESRWGFLNNYY